MADLTVPPRVWTELPGCAGTVLNETDQVGTVSVGADGEIRFSGPMRWRPAPRARRSVFDTSDLEAYWMSRNEQE